MAKPKAGKGAEKPKDPLGRKVGPSSKRTRGIVKSGPLDGCKAKLIRVDAQLIDIENRISEYRLSDFYTVIRKDDVEKGQIIFSVGEIVEAPVSISVIAGEILHNLRCPLDYLICALVERAGVEVTRSHSFPIYETWKGFCDMASKQLNGLPVAEWAQIERLQPYHATNPENHPLIILQELQNLDKHKFMHFAMTVPVKYWVLGADRLRVKHTGIASQDHLEVGTDLLTLEVIDGSDPSKLNVETQFACDIRFKRGETPNCQFLNLYKALCMLRSYIHQEVFSVEGLAEGFNWKPHPTALRIPWANFFRPVP